MKKFDQYRRELRRELFNKRLLDNDHSESRLQNDGRKLDLLLVALGFQLAYPSEWSRNRNSNPLEADISDLNLKDISEVGND